MEELLGDGVALKLFDKGEHVACTFDGEVNQGGSWALGAHQQAEGDLVNRNHAITGFAINNGRDGTRDAEATGRATTIALAGFDG
jgi:hypothetical protein